MTIRSIWERKHRQGLPRPNARPKKAKPSPDLLEDLTYLESELIDGEPLLQWLQRLARDLGHLVPDALLGALVERRKGWTHVIAEAFADRWRIYRYEAHLDLKGRRLKVTLRSADT